MTILKSRKPEVGFYHRNHRKRKEPINKKEIRYRAEFKRRKEREKIKELDQQLLA